MRQRLRRRVKAVAQWCQQHRHDPVEDQAAALNTKLRGHYPYYGRSTTYRSLRRFSRLVRCLWRTWLTRRTRGKRLDWDTFHQRLARHPLPLPRLSPAWTSPGSPGEEPSASIAHARVCEGRGRCGYGCPYSGTKPETVDTCQGAAYGCDRPLLLGDPRGSASRAALRGNAALARLALTEKRLKKSDSSRLSL